jgi:hypothetical protein
MTTQTIPFYGQTNKPAKNIPVTSQGRALYTVSWFMHGTAQSDNYDHHHMTIRDIVKKNV